MTGSYATASLANKSIPGDFLYSVKLATEKVRLALVRSPQAEVEMHIILSERRLKEIIASTEKGYLHEAAIVAMLDEADKAAHNVGILTGVDRAFMLEKVKSLCASQRDVLRELITIAPDDNREQILEAIETSSKCWNRCC
jgi:hypothetical protein